MKRLDDDRFELHFVTPEDPVGYAGAGLPSGQFHHVSKITTLADSTFLQKLLNTVRCFVDSYRVMKEVKPDAVVCIASPIAIPLCVCAKLFGKRTVFIESITRVSEPSLTGKILSVLRLCDRFYVQWPEAEQLYRGALYRGALL